jgi:hypothetical protein
LKAAKNEGRIRLRLGHIVLVNLDEDTAVAAAAFTKLASRVDRWRSPYIALHSLHAFALTRDPGL